MGSGNDARVPQKILRKCCSSLWALTLRTCSFAPSCIRGRWDHRLGDGTVSMAWGIERTDLRRIAALCVEWVFIPWALIRSTHKSIWYAPKNHNQEARMHCRLCEIRAVIRTHDLRMRRMDKLRFLFPRKVSWKPFAEYVYLAWRRVLNWMFFDPAYLVFRGFQIHVFEVYHLNEYPSHSIGWSFGSRLLKLFAKPWQSPSSVVREIFIETTPLAKFGLLAKISCKLGLMSFQILETAVP